MKKFKVFGILLLCLTMVLSSVLSGCSKSNSSSSGKIKVAFVYEGSIGDEGYDYAHYLGTQYLKQHLSNIEVTNVDNVPESADCQKIFESLAEKGYNVIFGTTFGYMDYILQVAKKYPNIVFMHCSGYKQASNVGTYYSRDYEGRYLTGVLAASYSKTGIIGYVAPMGLPEVIRNINALALGAESVNPKIKVKVVWINSWTDTAKEKDAVNGLVDAEADVLAHQTDSATVMQAAAARGVYAVSCDTEQLKFAPKAILGGCVTNWNQYYLGVVKSVQDKTWRSSDYWGGIKDGLSDMGPYGPMVSQATKDKINAIKASIVSGKLDVFGGPIYDQSGKLEVANGSKMTDDQLKSFNWFVKGVEGTIPKS